MHTRTSAKQGYRTQEMWRLVSTGAEKINSAMRKQGRDSSPLIVLTRTW